jgi:hypothetical protein
LVNDHGSLGVNCDEILMWHTDLFAARQFQRKGMKTVFQPASDLLNNHGDSLSLCSSEATTAHNFKSASVTAPSEALVTVWAYLAAAFMFSYLPD